MENTSGRFILTLIVKFIITKQKLKFVEAVYEEERRNHPAMVLYVD